MEDTGRVRRGYFVAGLGAAQFAQPGAVDLLRGAREEPEDAVAVTLAATDPANPYGALLAWPDWSAGSSAATDDTTTDEKRSRKSPPPTSTPSTLRASRSAGARVVLVDGRLAAWIARGDRGVLVSLPAEEPDRSRVGHAVAAELVTLAQDGGEQLGGQQRGWLIEEINGGAAREDPLARYLTDAGFAATAMGLQLRVTRRPSSGRWQPPVPDALTAMQEPQ